jgi:hypothetical protein
MFREPPKEPDASLLPPCAVCGQPAPNGFYDAQLCDGCSSAWQREAPLLRGLELAHAAAHPEDIEEQGQRRFAMTGESEADMRIVILKRGVTEHIAKAAALDWARQRRRAASRGAA